MLIRVSRLFSRNASFPYIESEELIGIGCCQEEGTTIINGFCVVIENDCEKGNKSLKRQRKAKLHGNS